MRILLFGGWGQLGTDIAAAAHEHSVSRPRRDEVDISRVEEVERAVADTAPQAVINAAAFHRVDLCEQDPDQAFRINSLAALNVARAANARGARTVFISTDYVFSGETAHGYAEDDAVSPVNVYGVSKAAGELAVREADARALVVRGSGMFGHAGSSGKGGNFVENMIGKAKAGAPLSVVDDQIFAPTATHDMAGIVLELLEHDVMPGTYHGANAGSCSWYELARTAVEIAGIATDLTPKPTGDEPVRRPRRSVLIDTKRKALGLTPSRSWQEALKWYLGERGRQQ